MLIRSANLQDIDQIVQLIVPFIDEFAINSQGRTLLGRTNIIKLLNMENMQYFVAEADCQIIGVIAYMKPAHLVHFFVDQDHQRQGIGRQLWDFVEADAKKNLITKFTVNSSCNAQKVYQAFGFKQSASVLEQHGLKFIPMCKNYELDQVNN